MDLGAKIKAQIEKEEKELEAYLRQANMEVAGRNYAIAKLKELLKPVEPEAPVADDVPAPVPHANGTGGNHG